MKKKILLLLLSLTAFSTAHAAVYLEPRVSAVHISGRPNLGDIGHEIGSDLPQVAAGIAIGYEISPRVSLELRYTHLGDLTIAKESLTAAIFPHDGPVAQVLTKYDLDQRTNLFAAALPFRVWTNDKLSLQLTPILQVELAKVELSYPPLPNVTTLAGASPVFYRRSTRTVQAAAEIALGYRLTDSTAVQLHYTYSPLSNFDTHLLGASLQAKF